jgi:hypothetical protein
MTARVKPSTKNRTLCRGSLTPYNVIVECRNSLRSLPASLDPIDVVATARCPDRNPDSQRARDANVHSYRSALTGSSRVARRAGQKHRVDRHDDHHGRDRADRDWIPRARFNQQRSQQLAHAERPGNSDRHPDRELHQRRRSTSHSTCFGCAPRAIRTPPR